MVAAMGPSDFVVTLLVFVAGVLATAGYGGVSVTPADFRKARTMFWLSAVAAEGAVILWGFSAVQPLWARVLVVGFAGLLVAVFLTEGLRWLSRRDSLLSAPLAINALVQKAVPNGPEKIRLSELIPSKETTMLRLQFVTGQPTPIALRSDNIFQWYVTWSAEATVSFITKSKSNMEGFRVPKTWNIYITFDRPVSYKQLIVQPASHDFPRYEVKYANAVSALIITSGDIPDGVVDIYPSSD
jgi:hypothetical protein